MFEKIFSSRKFSWIGLLLGGLAGYLYWKFVGCATGTCPLKSHWYTMIGYGLLMGWLVGDLLNSWIISRKKS